MLMMPLFIVGHYVDQKLQAKRERKEQLKQFRESMAALPDGHHPAAERGALGPAAGAPSVSDTVDAIYKLGPLLWTHRPEHTGFLGLRFGLGTAPSRIQFEEPNSNDTEADYMAEIQECMAHSGTSRACRSSRSCAPRVLRPRRVPRPRRRRGPRHGACSSSALHSPAEVVLAAITSAQSKERWEWLQWLPHVGSGHSPLSGDHLAAGPAGGGPPAPGSKT